MGYPNFYIYVLYTLYIPSPTLFYKKCIDRGVGVADPALAQQRLYSPPLASVGLISSSTSFTREPAAQRTGDLPICVLTALSVG